MEESVKRKSPGRSGRGVSAPLAWHGEGRTVARRKVSHFSEIRGKLSQDLEDGALEVAGFRHGEQHGVIQGLTADFEDA